jgi:hypothetical protein
MTSLDVHGIEKIEAQKTVFPTFTMVRLTLTDIDGKKFYINSYVREGVSLDVEWLPELDTRK